MGARGGAALEGQGSEFHQADVYGGIYLPGRWHFYSNWFLQAGGDGSVGWLSDGDKNAFVGTLGPFVELSKGKFPLTLEVGAAPTLLSRHQFRLKDFGDNFQFTDHVDLNWRIADRFTAGIRFQHMSNGGINHNNPGVNLEMLTCRFNF